MRLGISTLVIAALGALASAGGSVEFRNLDSKTRDIICTPQAGLAEIPTITLSETKPTASVSFPTGWIGNCYAVTKGAPSIPGILVELAFNGWQGLNFYDISTIVNSKDINGIKQIWPTNSQPDEGSGCTEYTTTCSKAYYLPDDIQTKSSPSGSFICTVGTAPSQKRYHARDFVTTLRRAIKGRDLYTRDFVLDTVVEAAGSQ